MASLDIQTQDNVVFLRGRLSGAPTVQVLPSGDEFCSFRLVVSRPSGQRTRTSVDAIDCRTGASRPRRTVQSCGPGTELEVRGSLRRRFWRGAGGVQSRYEVEVSHARRARPRTGA